MPLDSVSGAPGQTLQHYIDAQFPPHDCPHAPRAYATRRSVTVTYRLLGLSGVAGILTVVPPLEPALVLYGLGLIVWFVWLGIVMLRTSQERASRTPARAAA